MGIGIVDENYLKYENEFPVYQNRTKRLELSRKLFYEPVSVKNDKTRWAITRYLCSVWITALQMDKPNMVCYTISFWVSSGKCLNPKGRTKQILNSWFNYGSIIQQPQISQIINKLTTKVPVHGNQQRNGSNNRQIIIIDSD